MLHQRQLVAGRHRPQDAPAGAAVMPPRSALKILASPYRETAQGNPVQSLLYDAMEKSGAQVAAFSRRKLLRERWDVWHLHWPLEYVVNKASALAVARSLLMFALAMKAARFRGTKIFWTIHNIRSHEQNRAWLEGVFWRLFLPNVDGIICMSGAGRKELFHRHPRTRRIPVFTIPHGHYRGAYPDAIGKDEARAALDISADKFVALFFGQIRAYKGVPDLIRCFDDARLDNAGLLVAGKADAQSTQDIQNAAARASGVRLALGFVAWEEMQKYLRAADLVVLPYTEILNSGSAILALSFDRPILVPAQGALAELRDIVGSDWVRLYEGALSPDIVRDAVQWAKARPLDPGARARLDALSWDRIARMTLQAFAQ
jgi:glycosyltransferase involved in cell wall biosynthesis